MEGTSLQYNVIKIFQAFTLCPQRANQHKITNTLHTGQMRFLLPLAKVHLLETENLLAQQTVFSCNLVTCPQTFGTKQLQHKLQCLHFSSVTDLLRGQLHSLPR